MLRFAFRSLWSSPLIILPSWRRQFHDLLSLSLGSLIRLPNILRALIHVQNPLEFTHDPVLDLAPSLLYSLEFGRVAPFRLRLSPQVLLCCGGRPAPSALRGQVWFSNLKQVAWGCWTGPSRLPTLQAFSPEILLSLAHSQLKLIHLQAHEPEDLPSSTSSTPESSPERPRDLRYLSERKRKQISI